MNTRLLLLTIVAIAMVFYLAWPGADATPPSSAVQTPSWSRAVQMMTSCGVVHCAHDGVGSIRSIASDSIATLITSIIPLCLARRDPIQKVVNNDPFDHDAALSPTIGPSAIIIAGIQCGGSEIRCVPCPGLGPHRDKPPTSDWRR